ncbi:MerR family transcriptional regulator [Gordonia sp. Z-3]|uniref:MerR family transcriptional regulator n=1 Tax=unclassified Gordonia (in: high G+C Gram-positive bacteria) TaxID=2657482 RepID=UPI00095E881C|nr:MULTISPECIES: MerR family transcriptional regulator [unclassified Gordonia (in: high G+C Gram-positive bacteria)]MED5802152.1 MerR family transcriptional regulator [Gordonia sp. Z-3]OLT46038.1 MerR family transcriptional regulator [Gordonia sp. CNJ-863]
MTAEETEHFQIGEVAAATGLSVKTIRHYGDVGLVTPSARSTGGFRLYTHTDIDRLLVIRRMKPLGFTLDDMGALLAAQDTLALSDADDHERRAALATISEFRGRAETACRTLERQVEYARELVDQLADHVSATQRS